MRRSMIAVSMLTIAALAAATVSAAPAPGSCGKPPPKPGHWTCVSRRVQVLKRPTPAHSNAPVTFQRITVTWQKGSTTVTDSWDAN
jgi:hypothetical protein